MNRRLSLFIVTVLIIVVVVAASLTILYENGFLTPQGSRVVWQRDIGQFATGLTAADGKVFTIDVWGNISSYDAGSGGSVWKGSIGAYWGAGLVVSGGRIYGGKAGAEVGCLDEATGEFQWIFQAPVSSDLWDKRAPADITVVDGRVFATADGVGVHNATTGELLWEYMDYGNISDQRVWWVRAYPLEGNLVYAQSGGPSGVYTYRIDPDNGNVLWRVNDTFFGGHPIPYQGQVILETYTVIEQNYSQKMQVVGLNETTGASLWSYDVGAEIYQPTAVYNGLLLFGASDVNFYALNMDNGKLVWKIHVDSQNLLALVNSDNTVTAFPIQVDAKNQRVFWSFSVTQQLGTTSENKNNRYTGTVCSLDLTTGGILWTRQIEDSGTFYDTPVGLVVNKGTVFLTENYALWIFSASTGNVLSTEHFDHYILPPVVLDDRVFVAADLYLRAYG